MTFFTLDIAGTASHFFDSGNGESPLFSASSSWLEVFSSSFFFPEDPSCALTMREKATDFLAHSIFSVVQFLLLLADNVLSYLDARCFSAHFRYAKSNLLVSRRAAVGAHPR